jgi:hypothetical protein
MASREVLFHRDRLFTPQLQLAALFENAALFQRRTFFPVEASPVWKN